jgi:hypothetical protein
VSQTAGDRIMTNEQRIYQSQHGWFIETPGNLEGPMESREEAVNYANLLNRVGMARSQEVACTDQECLS